jgi:hypothetical protein
MSAAKYLIVWWQTTTITLQGPIGRCAATGASLARKPAITLVMRDILSDRLRRSLAGTLIAASSALWLSMPAMAALGDDQSALEAERVQLQASARALPGTAYGVVEMQTELGTVIREYVANSGTVFAVSWKGPFKPDLQKLLGQYFEAFRTAPREGRANRSRTHSRITAPTVIVQSGGRPRAFVGVAYLPRLLPAGVDPSSLQ